MPSQPRKQININLLIPFLIIALVFGIMIWQKYRDSRDVPVAPQTQPIVGKRTVVLFFVADGTRLEREARELDHCENTDACINDVLNELLNGPVGEYDEPLPEGTVVKSVRVDKDLAVIDLNDTFAKAMLSGSSAEMLAVYSIVNTVAANFPQIARVKLTVEGVDASKLRHLDLSEALPPDYTLTEAPRPESNDASPPKPSIKHKGKP